MTQSVPQPPDKMHTLAMKLLHSSQAGKLQWQSIESEDSDEAGFLVTLGDTVITILRDEYDDVLLQIYRSDDVDLEFPLDTLDSGSPRGRASNLNELHRLAVYSALGTGDVIDNALDWLDD